jgi:hypothetical protein
MSTTTKRISIPSPCRSDGPASPVDPNDAPEIEDVLELDSAGAE